MTSLRVGACLSLSGRYARFGTQAAAGLEAWRRLDGSAELAVEDDGGDPARVPSLLDDLARRCDLVLGPYSTGLMRAAASAAAGRDLLLWNHGGAGDDVQSAAPGHVVSVLTPASGYARPFVRMVAAMDRRTPLHTVAGSGGFGRQVCAGAEEAARAAGLDTGRGMPAPEDGEPWDLLCAGAFEEDVALLRAVNALRHPPRLVCAVAAGVRELGDAVAVREGTLGVAQWFPGRGGAPDVGPAEPALLAAYAARTGTLPDYPAVQAAAAAALAVRCAGAAGGVDRDGLWAAAVALDCTTMFGAFRIDAVTGAQLGHETVLVRWGAGGPDPGEPPAGLCAGGSGSG
jgi:ABC-type branched-subunit amino acid transport system substrate-binding protein